MNFVQIAAKADLILGMVLLAFSIYQALTQSYLLAGVLGGLALLSFISVRLKPSKWVARRILIQQLK